MSSIIQIGSTYSIKELTATHDKLPLGVYLMQYNDNAGEYYLVAKEQFKLPKKIYGKHDIIKRWLKSWEHNSEKNLGILLSGTKGSGKTITAQMFCLEAKMPVILVNSPHGGGYAKGFNNFVSNPILQNSIIFIDEFEKVYEQRDEQSELLSLLDGTFMTKLIFLLTVNENRLNDYLNNRLNRIKYHKPYADLEREVVDEVIDDMLVNMEHRDSIYKFFEKINMCTFDLLVNIIKEMNLFNEDALSCGAHLNLSIQEKRYNVYELYGGSEYKCHELSLSPGSLNSRDESFYINRLTVDYLLDGNKSSVGFNTSKIRDIEEDVPTISDKYMNYEVYMNQSDCEIKRMGKNIQITHKPSNLMFRLEEQPNYSLVF